MLERIPGVTGPFERRNEKQSRILLWGLNACLQAQHEYCIEKQYSSGRTTSAIKASHQILTFLMWCHNDITDTIKYYTGKDVDI